MVRLLVALRVGARMQVKPGSKVSPRPKRLYEVSSILVKPGGRVRFGRGSENNTFGVPDDPDYSKISRKHWSFKVFSSKPGQVFVTDLGTAFRTMRNGKRQVPSGARNTFEAEHGDVISIGWQKKRHIDNSLLHVVVDKDGSLKRLENPRAMQAYLFSKKALLRPSQRI